MSAPALDLDTAWLNIPLDKLALADIPLAFRNGGAWLRILVLRAMPYPEYLKTQWWQEQRAAVMKRDRWMCICGQTARDVHHHTYEHLGFEPLTDLQALCAKCHALKSECDLHQTRAQLQQALGPL